MNWAFDNSGEWSGVVDGSGAGTATQSFIVGSGSDRLLIVAFVVRGSDNITSVEYNGVTMTELATFTVGSYTYRTFYLLNPASGANDIGFVRSSSTSSTNVAVALSYENVTAFDKTVLGSTSALEAADPYTVSGTPANADSLIVAIMGQDIRNLSMGTFDSPANQRQDIESSNIAIVAGDQDAPTAASTDVDFTAGSGPAGRDDDHQCRLIIFEAGDPTATDERDAEIHGVDTDNAERDAEIDGGLFASDERDAEIDGQDTANAERDSEIDGRQILGHDQIEGSTGNLSDNILGNVDTAPVSGAVTRIHAHLGATGGGRVAKFAIYDAATDALLGQTAEVAVPTTAAWVFADLEVPIYLDSGQSYYIVAWADGSFQVNISRSALTSAGRFQAASYAADFPDPESTTNNNFLYSIYAEFIEGTEADSERDAEVTGGIIVNDERDAEIDGVDTDAAERDAETHGSLSASAERNAEIDGLNAPVLTAVQDEAEIDLTWTF